MFDKMMFFVQFQMEEEKLREFISVQELLDDEDEEVFNVCIKERKDIMMLCQFKNKLLNLYLYV